MRTQQVNTITRTSKVNMTDTNILNIKNTGEWK